MGFGTWLKDFFTRLVVEKCPKCGLHDNIIVNKEFLGTRTGAIVSKTGRRNVWRRYRLTKRCSCGHEWTTERETR